MVKPKEVIVGIDMGGTSLRALVVNSHNEMLAIEKRPTNVAQKPAGLIRDLAAMVENVVGAAGLRKSQLRAVSIGAPGAADPDSGVIYNAPNLGWDAVPLASDLRRLVARSRLRGERRQRGRGRRTCAGGRAVGRRNWLASLWVRESAAASSSGASCTWACGARRRRWAT